MRATIQGSGSKKGKTPIEAPNTLRAKAVARVIDVISEGEIAGLVNGKKSIFFDDTPLENKDDSSNFQGVETVLRYGLPDQDFIPGFPAAENPVGVGSRVVTKGPQPGPYTATINSPSVNAVRVTLAFATMTDLNEKTGDLNGSSVQIAIDVAPIGGIYKEALTATISGKNTSPYQESFRVERPAGVTAGWQFRVRRLTDDSTRATLNNQMTVAQYTELTDGKFSYPDTALVAHTINAEQFGSGIPTRAYHIYGIKVQVPVNYDPQTRTYTGIWDGTFKRAWTSNPAWIMYDLLVNDRYGMGDTINPEQVDKWALYQIGQYCDQLVPDGFGGQEPRFRFNGVIKNREEALRVVQFVASCFQGISYWASGAVTAVCDQPKDPVKLVTAANVINGRFTYAGTPRSQRYTVAYVTWNDPTDMCRPAVEPVEADPEHIARYGIQETSITAPGCTSRGQAHRFGKWHLDTGITATQTVNYTAGMDHADVMPGDIIAVADPKFAGVRMGGRLVAVDASSATLDAPITLAANHTYRISMVLPDNQVAERVITNGPGTHTLITWAEALPVAPITGAMFVITGTDIAPRQFRVLTVKEEEDNPGLFQVTALFHDPTKFARVEQNLKLEPSPYQRIDKGIGGVGNLTISEESSRTPGGTNKRLSLSWDKPARGMVSHYFVQYDRSSAGLSEPIQVYGQNYIIEDAVDGSWVFHVWAVSIFDLAGPVTRSNPYVLDSSAKSDLKPPLNLTVAGGGNAFTGRDLVFTFDPHPDNAGMAPGLVQAGYVVEVRNPLDNALLRTWVVEEMESARTGVTYYYDDNRNDAGGAPLRRLKVLVFARDTFGRISETSTAEIFDNPVPAPVNPTVTPGLGLVSLLYTSTDPDVAGAELHLSTSKGFSPGPGTLAADGPQLPLTASVNGGVTYYGRLGLYDSFGRTGMGYSPEFSFTARDVGLLDLTASSQVFKLAANGTASPASIDFTANPRGMTGGTLTWQVIAGNATLTSLGNNRRLDAANLTSDTATIQASYSLNGQTYQDSITVAKLKDGVNTINVLLSNEAQAVPADANGTVTSLNGAETLVTVFQGTSDVTDAWSFTGSASNCTFTQPAKQRFVVTALTADAGHIDITATDGKGASITRRFNLTKVRTGATGPAGSDAKLAVLTSNSQTFRIDKNGNVTPSAITLTATGQRLNGSPSFTVISGKVTLTGSDTTRTLSYDKMETDAVSIKLDWDGQTDTLSIVKLREGADGANGADAITAILTNEAHTLAASPSGVVGSYAGASTRMLVFQGTTDVTSAWNISIGGTSTGIVASMANGTVSVTSMSVDDGYVDVTATRSGYTAISKRFSLTKSKTGATGPTGPTGATGPAGSDAKLAVLTSDSQTFRIAKNGNVTPSAITLTATGQRLNGSPSFTVISGKVTLTGSDTTRTLSYDKMETDAVSIKIDWDGQTDTLSIVKLREGADGANGADAITAILTNEAHTLAASPSGVVGSYAGASTRMLVFQGTTDVTASWTISISGSTGATATMANGEITVTDMTADSGYVDITATRSGFTTINKRFSLTKSKTGATGQTGPTGPKGGDAKLAVLTSDSQTFRIAKNGTVTPSIITLTAAGQNLGGAPSFTVISGKATLAGSGTTRTLSYEAMESEAVSVKIDWDGQTDTLSIVKLREGADGANGAPALTAFLTNEAHTLAADVEGAVGSFAGCTTQMLVYQGITDTTNLWTFSIALSPGISATVSGNTVNVTALSGDSGFVDISADRSGFGRLTKRFSVNKSKTGATGPTGPTGPKGSDAKLAVLTSDSQTFRIAKNGNVTPSIITLTAAGQRLNGSPSFTVIAGKATLAGSGTTRTLSYDAMESDAVSVKIDWDGQSDTLSIVKLREGADGANGAAALTAFLTNEAHTLAADVNGAVGTFAGCTTQMLVYQGITDTTNLWTFSIAMPGGINATLSGNTVDVTALSGDSGFVDISADRGGFARVTKRFSVVKSKTGTAGANGANGTSVRLEYSADQTTWFPTINDTRVWAREKFTAASGSITYGTPFRIIGQAGTAGARGNIQTYRTITGASWSDSEANAAISTATGGAKVFLDTATLYNASAGYAETRFWNGSGWENVGTVLNGNLLVNGSVAAEKLQVNSLRAVTGTIGNFTGSGGDRMELSDDGIRIYSGNILRVSLGKLS
ncbi:MULTISPECIES: phage tail protein [unclassified Azospirillum]|uniref:TipJ family phage tail tip protein n=1 Tax=unclassified Azospirillum TaxID=2630922 RepID=UPI000B73A7C1|nr:MULTISPECIES: phage tail protein [unclassified Azospirillum]SNS83984.1 Phage-related protein, tail component [Azospirillum sp. RU38E]SNT01250.1 Phage-related protein, tail component [Azospirillum sp. RU37A]